MGKEGNAKEGATKKWVREEEEGVEEGKVGGERGEGREGRRGEWRVRVRDE